MLDVKIAEAVLVGALGGSAASLIFWIVSRLNDYEIKWKESRRVYLWLRKETSSLDSNKWRSTRAIASYNNLPEDRVRYLCSYDSRITRNSKEEEVWGVKEIVRKEK